VVVNSFLGIGHGELSGDIWRDHDFNNANVCKPSYTVVALGTMLLFFTT
jgi:hypothetical protein